MLQWTSAAQKNEDNSKEGRHPGASNHDGCETAVSGVRDTNMVVYMKIIKLQINQCSWRVLGARPHKPVCTTRCTHIMSVWRESFYSCGRKTQPQSFNIMTMLTLLYNTNTSAYGHEGNAERLL